MKLEIQSSINAKIMRISSNWKNKSCRQLKYIQVCFWKKFKFYSNFWRNQRLNLGRFYRSIYISRQFVRVQNTRATWRSIPGGTHRRLGHRLRRPPSLCCHNGTARLPSTCPVALRQSTPPPRSASHRRAPASTQPSALRQAPAPLHSIIKSTPSRRLSLCPHRPPLPILGRVLHRAPQHTRQPPLSLINQPALVFPLPLSSPLSRNTENFTATRHCRCEPHIRAKTKLHSSFLP